MARRSTKTSTDSKEIYRAMLEEIVRANVLTQPRCTPHVSSAIVHRYPTLRSLLDAFEACAADEAPQLLARLVCDGRTQRALGPQLSRRMCKKLTAGIYATFSSRDAKSTIE